MNLRVFAGRVATSASVPAATVIAVLRATVAAFADELARAGRFEWRGLGTFTVRTYPGRQIHNPATGQTIALPARHSVAFKPSVQLRSKLKPLPKRVSRTRYQAKGPRPRAPGPT